MVVDDEVEEIETTGQPASIGQTPVSTVLSCVEILSDIATRIPLASKSDGFMALLEVAVELSKITGLRNLKAKSVKSGTVALLEDSDELVKQLWDQAYAILGGLVSTIHGGEGNNSLVVKALLPSIMMTALPTVATSIPKEVQSIRKRALAFLLETQTGESSTFEGNLALQLLLQHICVEIPDKAEYRHAAHATIGEIMAKLYCTPVPGKSAEHQHAPRFVSFLLKYGRHKRPIYRLFAAEVVEELLLNQTFLTPTTISVVLNAASSTSQVSKKSKNTLQEGDDLSLPSDEALGLTEDSALNFDPNSSAMSVDEQQKQPETVVFSESDHLEMVSLLASFLLERSSDKIVNVRAKAIGALSTTLEFAIRLSELEDQNQIVSKHYNKAIRKVYFGTATLSLAEIDVSGTPSKASAIEHSVASPSIFKSPISKKTTDPQQVSLVKLIRRRLEDERSSVRKSALQLLETLCRFDRLESLTATLELFKNACFDPLLIIRKQASASMTHLLAEFKNCDPLLQAWVQSVPVLAFDAEQSVQDAAVKAFTEMVVERTLQTAKKGQIDFSLDSNAWTLFDLVTRCGSDANGRTIGKLFLMMAQNPDYAAIAKKFLKLLTGAASQVTEALAPSRDSMEIDQQVERWRSLELAVWKSISLLVSIPSLSGSVGLAFALNSWESIKNDVKVNVETKLRVLHTVGALVLEISTVQAKAMSEDLLKRLASFSVQPSMIQASIQLLVKLTDRLSSESNTSTARARTEAVAQNLKWMNGLLQQAEAELSDIVVPSDQGNVSEAFKNFSQVEALLFTIGEVAQFMDKKNLSGRLVTLLQTFISSSFRGVYVTKTVMEKLKCKEGLDEENAENLEIGGSTLDGISAASNRVLLVIPSSTRALAFVSLGKLCLQDYTLAKVCIAAFARELEVSASSVVRNNVMVVMCDLVVRYSNLVENYLSKLTICLRDENELVRRQTLLMLTNLLQEEFIKLRQGNLFYPLLLTLVDESEPLKQFSQICFENILSKHGGASHVFFSNFIEAIFFLNDYRMHPSYNQYPYSARERQMFNLAGGGKNRAKRFAIYKIFFDHMEDQHKYQVSFRLCEEVLQAFLEGQLTLNSGDEHATHLLYDVLCILSSEEIRLKHIGSKVPRNGLNIAAGGDKTNSSVQTDLETLDDDEIGNAKSIENQKKVAEATGQLAVQIVKKTTIERIVPIFIDLRTLLAKQHSPLLKNVMDYLGDLTRDMPDEMHEVLEHNRQLAMELAYETRLTKAIAANKHKKQRNVETDAVANEDATAEAMDEGVPAPVRRPKPVTSKRNTQSLTTVAGAPTPWKLAAPELSTDFAVPKLKTGMTPYRPSPASSRIGHSEEDDDSRRNVVRPLEITPQTPKTPKTSLPMLPPATPGDISSPMVNRMRRTSLVIRTPSSSNKQEQEKENDSKRETRVSPSVGIEGLLNDASSTDEVSNGARNAKRPRFIDSDSDDEDQLSKRSLHARNADPLSPMAKKPQPKRSKLEEPESQEETPLQARNTAAIEALQLSPARPSRPKRKN
jgi:hypothetical protein